MAETLVNVTWPVPMTHEHVNTIMEALVTEVAKAMGLVVIQALVSGADPNEIASATKDELENIRSAIARMITDFIQTYGDGQFREKFQL
jgi:hypothetical protein